MTSGERWLPIQGWDFYEVSDHGRIRSWKQMHGSKVQRRKEPRILKQTINPVGGYLYITLREGRFHINKISNHRDVKMQTFAVHRLVAKAFVSGYSDSLEVAHLDGTRTNNHFSNLSWVTRKQNAGHRWRHGTAISGSKHKAAEFCPGAINAIRCLYSGGMSLNELTVLFKSDPKNISRVVNCETYVLE